MTADGCFTFSPQKPRFVGSWIARQGKKPCHLTGFAFWGDTILTGAVAGDFSRQPAKGAVAVKFAGGCFGKLRDENHAFRCLVAGKQRGHGLQHGLLGGRRKCPTFLGQIAILNVSGSLDLARWIWSNGFGKPDLVDLTKESSRPKS